MSDELLKPTDKELQAHLERYIASFQRSNLRRGILIALLGNPFFIIGIFLTSKFQIVHLPNATALVAGHCILQVMIGIAFAIMDRYYSIARFLTFLAIVCMICLYHTLCYLNFANNAPLPNLIASTVTVIGLNMLGVILNPYFDRRMILLAAAIYSLSSFMIFMMAGMGAPALATIIVTFGMYAVAVTTFTGIRVQATSDFEKQRLRERMRNMERERDIELARLIQDSMAPVDGVRDDRIRIAHFQKKHEKVAGDWQATHKMEDGTVIAVVADATGKGVQAALVVRAVQTLWADAIGGRAFRPREWMGKVNRILWSLGHSTGSQTVTLGLVEIKGLAVNYYSAGHMPLYVRSIKDGKATVRCLGAGGGILGLQRTTPFGTTGTSLDPVAKTTIYLGSDGVFQRGTSYRPRELEKILDALDTDPNTYIQEIGTSDDRSLIRLEVG